MKKMQNLKNSRNQIDFVSNQRHRQKLSEWRGTPEHEPPVGFVILQMKDMKKYIFGKNHASRFVELIFDDKSGNKKRTDRTREDEKRDKKIRKWMSEGILRVAKIKHGLYSVNDSDLERLRKIHHPKSLEE